MYQYSSVDLYHSYTAVERVHTVFRKRPAHRNQILLSPGNIFFSGVDYSPCTRAMFFLHFPSFVEESLTYHILSMAVRAPITSYLAFSFISPLH